MDKNANALVRFFIAALLMVFMGFMVSGCSQLVDSQSEAAHSHEEEEVDDHSHGETGDEDETEIDHHGNPVYDEEERVYEQYIQDGVSLEFTVENFLGVGGRGGELAPRIMAGEHAVLQFHITDADSGEGLTGLQPAVWLDVYEGDDSEAACRANVEGYISGAIDARPIIDLNSYFILGMNSENTISVIDPMVDVAGMTNLFAVILLQGTPEDWAITPNSADLLATMPDIQKLAIASLDGFQVDANIELPGKPSGVIVQADNHHAWVAIESDDRENSGVAVIDVENREKIALIPTDRGTHDLAFSPDGGRIYVTNSDAGSLTVIDTATLEVLDTVRPGGQITAAAVSPTSGDIYLADQAGGSIYVLDAQRLALKARMETENGLTEIGISPDGTWGFALNQAQQTVFVFQTGANLITHAVPARGVADDIVFTESAAYFRSTSTPAIYVIPFEEINPTGNISVLTVPIGDLPPDMAEADARANSMAVTPDQGALLVSNPADDRIYFFVEGQQTALGGYQGHSLEPRAVQVVDRTLRERAPGVYNGSVRIPMAGEFSVAVLLSDPQIIHCFKFTGKENPELEAEFQKVETEIVLQTELAPAAGEVFSFQFELTHPETGETLSGVTDLTVLAKVLAGNWSQRTTAVDLGNGLYAAEVTFPAEGVYQLLFSAPSIGLDYDAVPPQTFKVLPAP